MKIFIFYLKYVFHTGNITACLAQDYIIFLNFRLTDISQVKECQSKKLSVSKKTTTAERI